MRVQKFGRMPAAAALVLVAGLSLAACNSDDNGGSKGDGVNATPPTSASSSGSATSSGSGSPSGGSVATAAPQHNSGSTKGSSPSGSPSGGPGATARSGAPCRTANLTFTKGSSHAQGDYTHITVKLTNSGSATCSLHGFPGLDLVGKDGRVSARRAAGTPGTVTLAPDRSAGFDLRVPRNNSGGSGVTFTNAVITPPDETHAHTMPLTVNLPVQEGGAGAQAVLVGPVTR
ncbi:MAG: DUF4232 domain-containing protein [Streptomyces sp.]|jgi:hypothetical protein|nr:DUF4232 domain-containing protein [Streptomyces sp.]